MRILRGLPGSDVLVIVLLAACGSSPGTATLAGAGGEAWTFDKLLTGRADASCAEVFFASPRGRVLAERDGETVSAVVPLAAGKNDVTAVCVGEDGDEAVSEPQTWDVRLEDRPTAFTRVGYADAGLRIDAGGTRPSEVRGAPVVAWSWSAHPGNPGPLTLASGEALDAATGDSIELATPDAEGDYLVDLVVTDADGVTDRAAARFRVGWGEAYGVDVAEEHPAWVDDAVVYGVVPFFFGGFAGVTDRLDELEALGVNVLWLSPVMDCPDDDFGYAVRDPFALRETFGSAEDFRALVDGAHDRGMRVILDFVANHTSDEHAYYLSAQDEGSPYHGWYDWDEPYYFEWGNLRNLDYDNPEVQRYEIEAFAWWVREYDVDGFRADAAWAVQARAPEFWPAWRAELQRIKPDLLLLSEATARDPYWFGNGFDVAYDWTWELGEWSWGAAWDDPEQTASLLRDALTNEGEGFDDDARVFRFLNNNDTGERFVTKYGPERVPVAATLLLTLPGVPCIFTGDEVGAEFEPYDEEPVLDWQDTDGLLDTYTTLVRLRNDLAALRSPGWELLDATPEDAVVAYLREDPEDPSLDVLVVLNFSGEPVTARFAATDAMEDMLSAGRLYDLLNEEDVRVADTASLQIELGAYGARVLAGPDI